MAKNRQQTIERMESELVDLQAALAQRGGQIEKLEAEQRGHMVAARVGKRTSAQSQIEQLSGEISRLRTENAFDCVAVEQLSADLKVEKATLRCELWQERCREVRELITPRLNGDRERSILTLALELKKQLIELGGSDVAIADAVLQLGHPRLKQDAYALQGSSTRRAEMIAARLAPLIPSPLSSQYMEIIGKADPGAPTAALQEILLELDAIAETEPQEAEVG